MHQTLIVAPERTGADSLRGVADRNRAQFDRWGITCLALVGCPGVGKTRLLERTLVALKKQLEVATLLGGTFCERDADRMRLQGIPTISARTDASGDLNAQTITEGLRQFESQYTPSNFDLVWIEKTIDLTAPDTVAMGEHLKVVLLDIAPGETQPLEYPEMFREANCVLVTNMDRASQIDVNLEETIANLRQVAPKIAILPICARTGEGLEAWLNWVRLQVALRNQSDKAAKHEMALATAFSGKG